ncbi:hypothetical protein C8R46DRAFT_1343987, partial [Mycena filopes]
PTPNSPARLPRQRRLVSSYLFILLSVSSQPARGPWSLHRGTTSQYSIFVPHASLASTFSHQTRKIPAAFFRYINILHVRLPRRQVQTPQALSNHQYPLCRPLPTPLQSGPLCTSTWRGAAFALRAPLACVPV